MSGTASASLFAIVLAAGGSRRFGSPKQLATFGGEPLAQRALTVARSLVGERLRVVLGAHAAEIAERLALAERQVILNPDWSLGLASSLRAGITQLPASCSGVLILLADQPGVTVASLGRLITAWDSAPESIIASRFATVIGAPCLFPRSDFGELTMLKGDQGARPLLERHAARVVAIAHPEAELDIDTPLQLAEIRGRTLR